MQQTMHFPQGASIPPFGVEPDEMIVVGFAGGGGSCTGIEEALGRPVDIAINHDVEAVAMHRANHPGTKHFCQNIWEVSPAEAVAGRKVGLAWFSPDCKHFSKAKGGKPVEKRIRDLAWVVVAWAKEVSPRIIMLENVEEFRTWGPLLDDGKPCPERKGAEFDRWTRALRKLGYKIEHRELRACDYGAPTIRKRFYLIARRDGHKIVWPKETHGPLGRKAKARPGMVPVRTAAECIDWSIPCPSIFLTREEGRAIGCNRPLAEATMRRIAKGVWRYVINSPKPFLIPITHRGDDRTYGADEPLRTVTTAHRGEQAVIIPTIVGVGGRAGQSRPRGLDEPTATSTAKADAALVAPYLVPRYGERPNQEPRTYPADQPMPVIVPTQNGGSLAAVHLAKFRGDSAGNPVDEPMSTVTANSYIKRPGGAPPQAVVAAFLAQNNYQEPGHDAREPVSTIVSKGCTQAIVTSHLAKLYGTCKDGQPVDEPAPTITAAGWHIAEVRAFLLKYYDTAVGQPLDEALHTATTRARFGLVTVEGVDYQIVDIGMRMLKPRELYNAQGFPPSYIIDRGLFLEYETGQPFWRPLTNTASIRMCGNSVAPPMARVLVAANCITPAEPVMAEVAD